MKRFLAAALLLQSFICSAQIDTVSNLSNDEKLYGLSYFWKEASYNFAYFEKTKINWDSAYRAFIPEVLNTKNTWEYYRVMQRFCALLKDGHTNINMPGYLQKGDINVDLNLEYLDDKVYITTMPQADSALVPLGSELIAVMDIPVNDFLEHYIFPYISYSAKHQLYNTGVNYILRPPFVYNNKPLKLTFRKPNDETVTYETRINTGNQKWVSIPNRYKYMKFFNALPDGIVLLQITSFQDSSIVTSFKKQLPELYKAKGIIIDLRNNGGGNSEYAMEILKYFTDKKSFISSAWKTPSHMAAFKAWGQYYTLKDTLNRSEKEKEWIKTAVKVAHKDYWYGETAEVVENNITAPRINAPLVFLIGNNTGSAAEDMLIALDDLKGRAKTIGERTYGSTGQPLSFDLPGGGSGRICTKIETYPDGREFVGYGIKPDIVVKRKIKDLLAGKDAALEKAIQQLTK